MDEIKENNLSKVVVPKLVYNTDLVNKSKQLKLERFNKIVDQINLSIELGEEISAQIIAEYNELIIEFCK